MKTIIYIDGFNLYYGALSKTSYKWLDVVKLFTRICKDQLPESNIVSVKFFTAPVKGKIATNGLKAIKSQDSYHKALKILYPEIFQIIQGYFLVEEKQALKFKKPIDKKDTVSTWRIEEKKTDVNIALEMFIDAQEGIEQIVLVSNDTDLVPAFEKIHTYHKNTKTAVIVPRLKQKEGNARPANAELLEKAHWIRHHITEEELESSQLPKVIPTKKKAVFKPSYW